MKKDDKRRLGKFFWAVDVSDRRHPRLVGEVERVRVGGRWIERPVGRLAKGARRAKP